jgi:hypothetical protein
MPCPKCGIPLRGFARCYTKGCDFSLESWKEGSEADLDKLPAHWTSQSTSPTPSEELVPRPSDLVLLEATADGTFVVFGEGDVTDLDVVPLTLMRAEDRHALGEAVANAVGGVNVAAQTLHGINQVRGLVRLAPQTLEALSSGAKPIVKEGWNLGTLAKDGKFVRQVRWLPAGSAGTVSILAAVGPAAALVAIQWQLAQISRLVEQNIALTHEVLTLIRTEQWADARAHHDSVLSALRHAQALGTVTRDIWDHVQAQSSETALRKNRQLFFEHVQAHARSLALQSGARARREWLMQNAEAVLRDIDALLMAERAWFAYQALRAASLAGQVQASDEAAQLQRRIVEDARAAYAEFQSAVAPLLDGLYRYFRLMEECPGGVGLALKGRRQTPAQVAEAAGILAEQIGALADWQMFEPNDAKPALRGGWYGVGKAQNEVARRLRWILPQNEELLAVAYGMTSLWVLSFGYIAFTRRRILLLKEGSFFKEGRVDREIPWTDVSAIQRSPKRGLAGGPDLIVSAGEEYKIHMNDQVTFAEADALVNGLGVLVRRSEALSRDG